MDFKETVFLLAFISASVAYLLFNYAGGVLGPYGASSDIYHEIILGAIFFMGAIFIYMGWEEKEEKE